MFRSLRFYWIYHRKPVVYLDSGLFSIDPKKPIVLKKGVSLKGSANEPTILTVNDKNATASIEGKLWFILRLKMLY